VWSWEPSEWRRGVPKNLHNHEKESTSTFHYLLLWSGTWNLSPKRVRWMKPLARRGSGEELKSWLSCERKDYLTSHLSIFAS
jgi:hypothetical protein